MFDQRQGRPRRGCRKCSAARLGEGEGLSASNLYQLGPLFLAVTQACLPGPCQDDVIAFVAANGPARFTDIVNGLADRHHENTVKKAIRRLTIAGTILQLADARYTVPKNAQRATGIESFVPDDFQAIILDALDALDGRALRSNPHGDEVGDRRKLFRHPGGLKELQDKQLEMLHPRLGYYRPDAPTPEMSNTAEKPVDCGGETFPGLHFSPLEAAIWQSLWDGPLQGKGIACATGEKYSPYLRSILANLRQRKVLEYDRIAGGYRRASV
jgi:hypothetical protein